MVVFAELIWTPGDFIQAEDRAHRIGQSNALEVHYITAPGSINDLMWGTVKKKVDIIHSVLGNGDPEMENEFAGMQFLRRLTEKMERQVE
jgi:SNF2 family DNA or RNA helicase